MKVIGLTGGIGSGKSTVARYLVELGAKHIDADKVIHEIYSPDTEGWHALVEVFGKEIVAPSGEIDRKKLGEIVFNDAEAVKKLNEIVHPLGYKLAKSRLEKYREEGVEVVVFEVILLFEAGWDHLADEIWVTVVSEDIAVKRLMESRGLTKEEILARIHSQTPNEERVKKADVVINNDGTPEEMKAQVKALWERIHS
jgi:dephospho-CoA kinase